MKKKISAFLLAAVLCLGLTGTALAAVGDTVTFDPDYGIQTPSSEEQPSTGGADTSTTPAPSGAGADSERGESSSNVNLRTSGSASHGRVTCSPSSPEAGDTVTVTARPDEGYQVQSLTVKDSRGHEVEVTKEGDNKFTFTMPSGKISVIPVFTRIQNQTAAPGAGSPFADVPAGAYYADAVAWAVENGITTGITPTTFSPNSTCTRGQTVTFLWRAAGSPAPKTTENPFKDVKPGDYCYQAVLWAVENGITTGVTADTFSPGATVTRGQTVTFLHRAAGSPAAGGAAFADVAEGAYYVDAVAWAAANGITGGTTATTFSPNAGCTRGQIVTFLYRSR